MSASYTNKDCTCSRLAYVGNAALRSNCVPCRGQRPPPS